MIRMRVGVLSCLLLLFLVFASLLLHLHTLSIDATGMRESLSFYILVVAFVVVVELSLFLVVRLLLQLRTSTIEELRMRESVTFATFVMP